MPYSWAFFDLQLRFAHRLATKFRQPFADILFQYTTFTVSFGADDWAHYIAGLEQASDPTTWTYHWYLDRCEPEPMPTDTHYYGQPLFGCFYYYVREGTVIRPHFTKNDLPGMRPLSQDRMDVRQNELRRMFAYIFRNVPEAQTVLGNSWIYNLEAYRRLYPPKFVATLPTSTEDEFQYLALWGQCFDKDWFPKANVAQFLLQQVDELEDMADLRLCFPYQVCQPECEIAEFYSYYGIGGRDTDTDNHLM